MGDVEVNGMLDPEVLIREVEERVGSGADMIDAIVDYCERNGIEIEVAAAIVKRSEGMRSRLQAEAESLNYLPKTSRLPI
jgi:hypothetical protein